jgi:hexosaminidase
MKKVLKMILYFFCSLLILIISLIIVLFVYYSFLEKKQVQLAKELENRSKITHISEKSGLSHTKSPVINLIPVPKKVEFTGGNYSIPANITFSVSDSLKNETEKYLQMIPGVKIMSSSRGENIQFIFNKALSDQGYILNIKNNRINIDYSSRRGLYYAIVSLKVLKQNYKGTIPCVYIEDSPDLAVRGLMLDISRDKVPTLETLVGIAQLLADLKYNHLELYIEGFSFAYPSFKKLWEGKETPLTGDEIRTLDAFCRAHNIDLVPNQNSLGHMMAWLATDEFKDLAECPNGYKMLGIMSMKSTLDPSDPRSIDLLTKMTEDLLPNFTSTNFNINLDEPFELGKGKSKELCKKKGEGQVYLDYAEKMHTLLASKNKKILMWGDIVMRHPELIPQIPKDVTVLDWGYESSYPYERHCKVLQASGLEYMVCPGTNSWTSITGRTDNMLATIEVATVNATKYGAKGMLLTDWGDMGHWQYLPVSYAGYTTGAALSWNSGSGRDLDISTFLNSYVFMDRSSGLGDIVLDLGRYNRFEEFPLFNMTTTLLSFQLGLRDKIMIAAIFDKVIKGISDLMKDIAPEMISVFDENYENRHSFDYNGLQTFIDSREILLKNVKIGSQDSMVIRDEYLNSIKLIRLGAALQNYIEFRNTLNTKEEKSRLQSMKELCNKYLIENKRLWMIRNKPGGYDRSVGLLNSLNKQIDARLLLLDKSSLARELNRFLEKIGTAGAVLYLRATS